MIIERKQNGNKKVKNGCKESKIIFRIKTWFS